MGRVSLDGGYARFRETFAVGRMGDNHIITHRFRQQREAGNTLEDNELTGSEEMDDWQGVRVTRPALAAAIA